MNKKKIKKIGIGIILFLFGYISSYGVNFFLKKKQYVYSHEELFNNVWEETEKLYPFTEPSTEQKMYSAIKGLVASYKDPYSTFYTPEQTKQFHQDIDGEFAGAGMEIGIKNGFLIVVSPLVNSPAEKAGFLPHDIIVAIDGEDISHKTLNEVIAQVRGEKGTKVIFDVLRKGEKKPLKLTLTRDIVKIPILTSKILSDTFIISLYNFNEGSETEFKKALSQFIQSGKRNLLLDLRNNPGGYLSSSIDIASYFLDQGKIILREDYGEEKKEEVHRSKGFDLLKKYSPKHLGVLINDGSASASEIVAGALQDYKKAYILGTKSYGKGSVQQLLDLDNNTALKITVAKWLTPLKKYISEKGIQPDIEIDQNMPAEKLLEKAVQLLEKS